MTTLLIGGGPASGKDTVTEAVIAKDRRFVHFRKHKMATGGKRDKTYHLVSAETFQAMAAAGDFIQYHVRYERGYGISRAELIWHYHQDKIPIIHPGRIDKLQAVRSGLSALGEDAIVSVLLYASESATTSRLKWRHPGDVSETGIRRDALREEVGEYGELIAHGSPLHYDLIINTEAATPEVASGLIIKLVNEQARGHN